MPILLSSEVVKLYLYTVTFVTPGVEDQSNQ